MISGGNEWLIGVALIGFAFGVGAGFLLAWLIGGRNPQLKKMEAELAATKAALEGYRGQVHTHFARTSDLFQEVTERYRDLYDHLAEGNRDLCENMQPAPLPEVPHQGRLES